MLFTLVLHPFLSVSLSHILCLLHQRGSFSFTGVSTVIPVVPPLPEDSDWGEQCLFLFWLCNGRLTHSLLLATMCPSFLQEQWSLVGRPWKQSLQGTNLYADGVNFRQPSHCGISIYLQSRSKKYVYCQLSTDVPGSRGTLKSVLTQLSLADIDEYFVPHSSLPLRLPLPDFYFSTSIPAVSSYQQTVHQASYWTPAPVSWNFYKGKLQV